VDKATQRLPHVVAQPTHIKKDSIQTLFKVGTNISPIVEAAQCLSTTIPRINNSTLKQEVYVNAAQPLTVKAVQRLTAKGN
jgi:hypothetical protein